MQVLVFLIVINSTNFNRSTPARDTVIIDSVPFTEWNYGSTPTASSMILWFWDFRDYGRLVDFFFDRWDPPYGRWKYNVPNTLRELALAMHTDSMTGGTYISNISPGIVNVANTINGYSFQSQCSPLGGPWNNWVFSWIKNEIDNGRPCLWIILDYWHEDNHINTSLCAIGYIITPSDTFIIAYDTWNNYPQVWPLWTYQSGVYSNDYGVTIEPGGADSDNVFILFPTDSGLVFHSGDTLNITWDSRGNEVDYLKIWHAATYDSIEWTLIEPLAPNTGLYAWVVPEESLNTRIVLQGFNAGGGLEAADGSFYSFTIQPTGVAEQDMMSIKSNCLNATFINGPLLLPDGRKCRVFDITGRVVVPQQIKPGIYFIEVDGWITHKVVKVK